eukprot:gb/GEZN01011904.1/.p1 GENE.gb/GEZN01011904.1/~~gb/GEZN01011904.1/.p1  ORF type:complete len:301 (+),score=23.30 gb/GEZN01011904.1/:31-933(+)
MDSDYVSFEKTGILSKRSSLGLALTLSTFLAGCGIFSRGKTASPVGTGKYFKDGMEGCFLLYNMKTSAFEKVIAEETCKKRYPASNTFMVPLAVMAFDSEVLKDENSTLKWDGNKDWREVVNHDHSAKTWMRETVVWFSQRLAVLLGENRVKSYLHQFHYGNENISGGFNRSWLIPPHANISCGALNITAYEQAEFMRKLWQDQLPVSKRAMDIARNITLLETSPKGFTLSGKTGSSFFDDDRTLRLGWFICHVQKGDREYIAITNFRDHVAVKTPDGFYYGGPEAKSIALHFLLDAGLW